MSPPFNFTKIMVGEKMEYSKYRQIDLRDCGPACIAFICANYYKERVTIAKCREHLKTDVNGTNFQGMIEGSKKLGFDMEGLQGEWKDFLNEISEKKIKLPCIVHIVAENKWLHFVVVQKIKKGKVIYFDPAYGKRKTNLLAFEKMYTGYILAINSKLPCNSEDVEKPKIKELVGFSKKLKKQMMFAIIISVLMIFISVIATFSYQYLIDAITEPVGNQFKRNVLYFLCCVIGIYLIQMFLQIGNGVLIAKISRNIDKNISNQYITKLALLNEEFYHSRTQGEILTRFYDVNEVCQLVTNVLFSAINDLLLLCIGGSVLFYINSILFLLALMGVLLFAVIILIFKRPIEHVNRTLREQYAIVTSCVKELIEANEILKLYQKGGKKQVDSGREKLDSYLKLNFKSSILERTENALLSFVQVAASILILGIGMLFVEQGALTLGSLVTFEMLLSFILYPIEDLAQMQPEVQKAFISMARLNDILDYKEEAEENQNGKKMIGNSICFDKVSFRYGFREEIFHDISFSIPAGSKCILLGKNGTGKSTLAKLMLRFYEPTVGIIYIGNSKLQDLAMEEVRCKIEYVVTNPFFFQGSIEDNLRIAKLDAKESELLEVCETVGLSELITKLPQGINTILEEGAKNLSVGERQKLALARTILKNPDIIIFDEALSGIDKNTRKELYRKLLSIFKDSTCVFISHIEDLIEGIDCIYCVDEKNVVRLEKYPS